MKGCSKRTPSTREPLTLTEKDLYGTPDDFYAGLDAVFHFNLDAAADADNTKCDQFITAESDALKTDWYHFHGPNAFDTDRTRVWLNPPYSKGWKEAFCSRAIEEVANGHAELVTMLLPANTADGYWTDYVWPYAAEILHVQGRLAFKRPNAPSVGADFPSAVVIYRPHIAGPAVGMIDRQGRIVAPPRLNML